jgi:hypothetical protein
MQQSFNFAVKFNPIILKNRLIVVFPLNTLTLASRQCKMQYASHHIARFSSFRAAAFTAQITTITTITTR